MLSFSNGESGDDGALVGRIVSAFRKAEKTDVGAAESMWLTTIAEKNATFYSLLKSGNVTEIAQLLQAPGRSNVFFGFDHLAQSYDELLQGKAYKAFLARVTYDSLIRLAEAVGASRLENPESSDAWETSARPDVENVLAILDNVFGYGIAFPNPFPGEAGVATSRGIASYRAIQSIYQAYRIRELVRHCATPRILEIGAGLGRTAYYAWQLKLHNYRIVDLPFTNVSQAYFLGRVLGPENIRLYGEEVETKGAMLEILPPEAFFSSDERFDLVVNVDSMTEMAPATAQRYLAAIAIRAKCLLSINHELNPFTVRELLVRFPNVREASRSPYWLRKGYVEETVRFD